MKDHDRHVIHSSEEANWRTPPACFSALDREFDFTLDAAADQANRCAGDWLGPGGLAEDALTTSWGAHLQTISEEDRRDLRLVEAPNWGTVFLNPPFSRSQLRATKDPSYDIAAWAKKCWEESQAGCTIVGIFPFAPQTDWYKRYVWGIKKDGDFWTSMTGSWSGHAAMEERRLPHRISFLKPDGSPSGNAGVNSAIIVWKPNYGIVGPWQPHTFYWSYR